ncbi:WD-40 repeat-containing protein [Nostoc carneum NIES-2107]|nr:WD-40 repeat-containing protein [Nostoc carneum NIES-2107]
MSEFSRNLAFIVGINNYTNGISPLQNAVNDAKKLVEILREKHEYKVWVCLDEVATLKNLNQLLEKTLAEQVSENDRLLFYFAGHGIALNGDDGPTGYLIPQDAKLNATETYLPMTKLQESLEKLPCHHFLGILDCCFAGAFRWSSTRDLLTTPEVIHKERYDRFITDPAWQVITSAAYDQKALDAFVLKSERGQVGNHSPFAAALIEALAGKADAYPPSTNGKSAGDGVITATELYLYLRDAVEPATEGNRQRQTPGIWPLKKHDKGEYIFLNPGHELNLPPAPPLDASKNPYRGLESYDEEHRELFFGRSKLVEKLHQFVKSHPLTVVLGASGSGKSSLVKAGLIPQLRQDHTEKWEILEPIRPGETPLQALNNALKNAQLPEIPAQNPEQNLAMSIDAWAKNHPKSKLLLFIDQSEEIITLCQNEDERKEFFQQILTAINVHRQRLRVVLSLRSDFEPQIRDAGLKFVPTNYNAGNTELKSRWYSGRFIVPAMTRGELREAIEKPAEARVMYFQPHELVEQLIDEVADMPGALPLLSFALSELYLRYLQRQIDAKNRGITIDRALTQADYQDLGGVIQSLTQKADAEYEVLVQQNPAYDQIIRQVMLRMVAIGGGELARRRVPLSELEYPPPKHDLVKEVIERFTKARLLVTGEDAEGNYYVEPAHDALVRGWQKLLGWKQEDEASLLLQRELTPDAQRWANFKNQDKEQQGILDKAAPVLVAVDRILLPIENFVNQIPANLARRLRSSENQQGQRRNKSTEFLWDTNPYLDVLDEKLNSDENWFNQLETEFVQKSLLQKRQNHSWRWRIAQGVILTISAAAVIAFIQWINAQKQLVSTIGALTNGSQELFDSNKEFDALLTSINAGKQVKQEAFGVNSDMQFQVKVALQNAVLWVKERNRLEGHKAEVYSVSLSPDGQLLASASADKNIKLWDATTGKQIKTFNGHGNVVNFVTFSPSGRLLVSASSPEKSVKLWDVATGKEIVTLPGYNADGNGCNGLTFDPSEQVLAIASEGNIIKLWDISTRKEIATFTGHKDRINSVSLSPDGRLLASGSFDNTIKLWDVATHKEIKTLSGHRGWVFSVRFSPNGRLLASGSDDSTVKLWDVATRKEITTLKGHTGRVQSTSFSPDGRLLASGSSDSTIKLWDVTTNKEKEIDTLTGHRAEVNGISFSTDGQVLASASYDSTIKLWNVAAREEIAPLKGHSGKVSSVSFSPDGRLLASGSWDHNIKLWDVDKRQELDTLSGHRYWVQSVNFSPDGRLLVSGSWDHNIKLWDVDKRQELDTLSGHRHWVMSANFSPDGRLLASGSWDGIIKLWDVVRVQEIPTLKKHKDVVRSINFSPNGQLLASGSGDSTIKLWDVATRKEIATLTGHISGVGVNSVSFSPNGRLLASGGGDNTVKLWDIATRKEIATLIGHRLQVTSVSFSPSGKLLASTSNDHTIRLWDVATRKQINILNGRTDINSVSFNADEKLLASGSSSGTVVLWNLEILSKLTLDDLMARGCDQVRDYLENNPNVNESDRHLCDNVPKLVGK